MAEYGKIEGCSVITEIKTVNKIVQFNEFELKLSEFKKKYDAVIYDLTIPAEEKQARSDRLSIGKVIARLDDKHKEVKAPIKEKVVLLDGERKRIKDELILVQDKIKSQIAEHERKIQEQKESEQKLVDNIYDAYVNAEFQDSENIKRTINCVASIDIDEDCYFPVKAQAALAISETLKKLQSLFSEVKKREDDKLELDRLRKEAEEEAQKERDELIAKEAADRVHKEAEAKRIEAENKAKFEVEAAAKREADAMAALKKSEDDRIAAEAKARRDAIDAENRRIVAEQEARERQEAAVKAAEEKAKRDAEQAKAAESSAAKARAANKKHKASINNKILDTLLKTGITEAQGKDVITAIAMGKVPNVKIEY